jgi:hypothetical protein
MSILTFLLLALSLANLGLVVVALVRPDGKRNELSPTTLQRPDFSGVVALSLGSLSQLSYLFLLFAWQLHWMRFYPSNPIQTFFLAAGILLSIIAFLAGCAASGLRRLAAIIVAVTTAFLWLLAAIASASI